ncbi:MAG: XdhC family protein [Collinsella sp.]|nr:XdhC family protein [Collinsella sp.]
MEKIDIVSWMLDSIDADGAVEFVVVTATDGSAPRGAGAWMAVRADGSFAGTVGGGRLEALALQRAPELLASASSELARYDIGGAAKRTGMVCGGVVDLCFAYLDASARPALETARDILATRGEGVLSMSLASFGGALDGDADGDKTVSGDLELRVETVADQSSLHAGVVDGLYLEPLCPEGFAYVIGCGHVGRALVPVLVGAGFAVIACDNRPEALEGPGLDGVLDRRVVDYADIAPSCPIGPRDLVVASTSSHGTDLAVVTQALAAGPAYLGCMGSKKKTAFVHGKLEERGFTHEQVTGIHMPVGVPIACETPAEIAISIAAEMIDFRRTHLVPRA